MIDIRRLTESEEQVSCIVAVRSLIRRKKRLFEYEVVEAIREKTGSRYAVEMIRDALTFLVDSGQIVREVDSHGVRPDRFQPSRSPSCAAHSERKQEGE